MHMQGHIQVERGKNRVVEHEQYRMLVSVLPDILQLGIACAARDKELCCSRVM